MPTFYNFRQNGLDYSFDDIFVPADLFREGNLFTWGDGGQGRLGNNNTTNSLTPITTFAGGTNWKQGDTSANGAHTAAIKTDGTLWLWGFNPYGQLGDNTSTGKQSPITTFAGGTNWKQVSAGYNNTAAIKTDGTLWTWGRNNFNQLGNNNATNSLTPITTFAGGTNWKQVSCTRDFMGAIKTDGTLWTWGSNSYGQLGDNTVTRRSTPVTTFAGGTNWKQLGCSTFYTAAIKTDGTLWTWGRNNFNQLGNNNATNSLTPITTFAGGTNWKQVSSGGQEHNSAIKTDGTLWIWGRATSGRLGNNNSVTTIPTPITTFAGGNNWKQTSNGPFCSLAVKTDGTLWGWGFNANGQLGNNAGTNILTPITTFAGGSNWRQVSGGDSSTLALTYIDSTI